MKLNSPAITLTAYAVIAMLALGGIYRLVEWIVG